MSDDKAFRIAEIFGPTIQGEGRLVGTPCYFVRFGGCDYRCSWCDTPHAVLPELVAQLPRMTPDEILAGITKLPSGPKWVVLTGGNPLLFDLSEVCDVLRFEGGFQLMVETQGTIYKTWLDKVEDVCISPKPPSAGKHTPAPVLWRFLNQGREWPRPPYLKLVVFDDADYKYAQEIHQRFSYLQMFLSTGNWDPTLPTVGNPNPSKDPKDHYVGMPPVRELICDSYRELCEKVASDRKMRDVRVLPQLHVLAWGNQRGH